LSQSAHFSLQLPYTVLGLGRSANFLDHLYVGIPRPSGVTVRNNTRVLLSALYSLLLWEQPPAVQSHGTFERDAFIEVSLRPAADKGNFQKTTTLCNMHQNVCDLKSITHLTSIILGVMMLRTRTPSRNKYEMMG